MSTKTYQLAVQGLTVDVVRKDIKNLHLGVYPPTGRVRVAAPLSVTDEAIRLFTISKLAWIKRQQAKFHDQERQTAREVVSGESHYYHGRRYLLNVVYRDAPASVSVRGRKAIDLYVRPGSDTESRQRILHEWYRGRLKEEAEPLIAKWEAVLGVKVASWGVRQMKTKWGTCNIEDRRIWLNPELVKKPRACLEYVVVHELMHLHERHHNDRFASLMSRFLPLWEHLRAELNRAPLGHASWDY